MSSQRYVVVGVKWWNGRPVSAVLTRDGVPPLQAPDLATAMSIAVDTGATVVSWASRTTAEDEAACRAAGVALVRIEDGFVRSVGLGAGLTSGCSFVLDGRGIYYDATRPSDLEHMLRYAEPTDAERRRGEHLIERLREARVTKYNVGRRTGPRVVPAGRRGVLVPGQVAVDAGVRRTVSATIDCARSENVNLDLLRLARERNEGAFLVYKPHPDVAAGLRPGAIEDTVVRRLADAIAVDDDITGLIEQCEVVETLSSLAGFEALVRSRKVVVHGLPFYAGWGLTEDLTTSERRGRRRSLAELVVISLVGYGRYVDPRGHGTVEVEQLIDRLASLRDSRLVQLGARVRQHVSKVGRRLGF